MAAKDNRAPRSARELRTFGITLAVAFGLIALYLWWRGRPSWTVLATIAAAFLAPALVWPALLRPVEWAWMKGAHFLGAIMTRVLLTLTFYLMITPLGLLLRLFGKDSLMIRRSTSRQSYWIPVEPDGPCSRPDKPY